MPLFAETVRGMLHMLQRMTVWAQNFQVAQVIVFAVSVFVMHTQNFLLRVIPTTLTFKHHTPCQHGFSNRSKRRNPFTFSNFVDASSRAIFSFFGWRTKKIFSAMSATIFYTAFFMHSFVVAFWRTVFGFVCAASNVGKFRATFIAICRNFNSCSQSHATSAAVLRGIFSVFRHHKNVFAMRANFFIFNAGASYAIH